MQLQGLTLSSDSVTGALCVAEASSARRWAVARSILVIVWHLLADPTARYVDLGSDFYEQRLDADRKTRSLIRQLQALGHQVTLSPAA